MSHVITRLCVLGGECMEACPAECIVPGPLGSLDWPYLYIDPDGCIDCGACVAECPAGAIFPEDEVPAAYAEDIGANRRFFAEGPAYWDYDLEQLKRGWGAA